MYPLARIEHIAAFFNNYNFEYNEETGKYEAKPTILDDRSFTLSDFNYIMSLDSIDFFNFCQLAGIIKRKAICPSCGSSLTRLYFMNRRRPFYRCNTRTCTREKLSALKNTIFEQSRLPPNINFALAYFFSFMRVQSDCEQSLGCGDEAVRSAYKLFRSSLFMWLSRRNGIIGGNGVTVHMDETPITRRHGRRGCTQRSNTVWVIGAVDVVGRKACMEFLPSRGHQHVLPFVNRWIKPHARIHTDCLRTYDILGSLGFEHNSVNHSRYLVGPDGTHTNHIEGIFGNMKKLKRHYSYNYTTAESLNFFCSEWIFRFCYDSFNRNNAFRNFILILRDLANEIEFELTDEE